MTFVAAIGALIFSLCLAAVSLAQGLYYLGFVCMLLALWSAGDVVTARRDRELLLADRAGEEG